MEQLRNNPEQPFVVRPISPDELVERQKEAIPQAVLAIVNDLITQNVHEGHGRIYQKDIVAALVEQGFERREIFDKHMLDFEDIYRESGWDVTYDKPAYNEDYEPNFTFESRMNRRLGSAAASGCVSCRIHG